MEEGMAESGKGGISAFFDLTQSILTCVAILLAGWWFFAERKNTVHANLSVEATAAKISPDLLLVQGTVKTDNVGHVVLETDEWTVRLMSVVPTDLPLADIAGLGINDWPAKMSDSEGAPSIYEDHQLQWYKLREFVDVEERTVEPGETDFKHVDFLVPCRVQVASLAVWVKKPATTHWLGMVPEKEQWWSARALLPLGELCARPVGSTQQIASATK
jgi:hypothetical protein